MLYSGNFNQENTRYYFMLLDIVQKLNWIDIVIIVIALRAFYIGLKRGFVSEIFHLFAVLAAIFVIFHYYPMCSKFLENRIFFKLGIAKAVAFIGIWVAVALIAKFVRDGVNMVFKIEAKSFIDKFGGLLVALGRGALVCSLLLCFFIVTDTEYLSRNVQGSYLSPKIVKWAPDIYRSMHQVFVSKYFPNEKINPDVVLEPEKKASSAEHKDLKNK